jgi:CRISPR-associated endonuclease Csn1
MTVRCSSRAERRRARGEGHSATIRQIAEREGEKIVFERKSVESLTEKDLLRVKDPERNAKLIENIRTWIADGKKKGTWPKSPKGDDVKKVRLETNKKVDVLIREGAADRGEMARVDVFRKQNRKGKWEFFLVPVYPHQVADEEQWPVPPGNIVQGGKDESEWPEITADHQFIWSVYQLSFLEIEKPDGTIIDGYFRGMDRSTGAINVSPHYSKVELVRSIGVKTLKVLVKHQIDRLGRRFPIERETRTWHGVACT